MNIESWEIQVQLFLPIPVSEKAADTAENAGISIGE